MSSNNVRHRTASTVTTLQHFASLHHTSPNYTSLHLSTLHFLAFILHYPLIWLNPSTFPAPLFHLTSLNQTLVSLKLCHPRCVKSIIQYIKLCVYSHIHAVKNTTIFQMVSPCNMQHYVIYNNYMFRPCKQAIVRLLVEPVS